MATNSKKKKLPPWLPVPMAMKEKLLAKAKKK